MQATARRLSVVSATSCARRRLIRDVSVMKPSLQRQALIIAFCGLMTVASWSEPKCPFAEVSGTPPVYDSAYYAKRAKEDADHWRAFLKKIEEPDLEPLKGNAAIEVYRFIYRPHFSKALVLTVKKAEAKLSFEIRRLSEKDAVELRGSVDVDEDTFDGIREAFAKPEAYDPLRGLTPSQRDDLWSVDGSWWHLETLRNGKHTHAVVWSPETISSASKEDRTRFRSQFGFDMPDLKPFEKACLELVQLSGLPLDAKYYEPRPEQKR
jgi:hypothetical protein